MNKLHITKNTVKIEIKGFDKILSFRGSIMIPKGSIAKVYKYDGQLKPAAFRLPGTYLPGIIIAGTFITGGRREFWNVHWNNPGVVIDLRDFSFTRIVVQVEDVDKTISELSTM